MKNKIEGYKFTGDVEEYQPMGSELKPVHEMEVTDLSDPVQVEELQKYLKELDNDPSVKALNEMKRPKMSMEQKKEMALKDPAGTFIIKDGKRISLAQYMKNSKSMNTRKNFDFQSEKENSELGDKANTSNSDNNAMVFNTKKVK